MELQNVYFFQPLNMALLTKNPQSLPNSAQNGKTFRSYNLQGFTGHRPKVSLALQSAQFFGLTRKISVLVQSLSEGVLQILSLNSSKFASFLCGNVISPLFSVLHQVSSLLQPPHVYALLLAFLQPPPFSDCLYS